MSPHKVKVMIQLLKCKDDSNNDSWRQFLQTWESVGRKERGEDFNYCDNIRKKLVKIICSSDDIYTIY